MKYDKYGVVKNNYASLDNTDLAIRECANYSHYYKHCLNGDTCKPKDCKYFNQAVEPLRGGKY